MQAVENFFNFALMTVWGTPVTVLEVLGFITGALCVWGVTRQALWNWPVSIANNIAFGFLFLRAHLYGEMALQVAFGVLSIYGWWAWRKRTSGDAAAISLPVRRVRRPEAYVLVGITAVATVIIALVLDHGTDSPVPWPDAFVLSASLTATFAQARKVFEAWWVWILIDVIAVPLYISRGLYLTAILYVGFLALCVLGLRRWRQDMINNQSSNVLAAAR